MQIDTEILKKVVRVLAGVANPRAETEVLQAIHVIPAGGAVVLRATDTMIWAEAEVVVPGAAAGPGVGVAAAELARLLGAAEGSSVVLEPSADRLRVRSGVDAVLQGLRADELPEPPDPPADTAEADLEGMARAVARVRHAVSRDETRGVLRCLHVVPDGEGLRVEATDGYRAAWTRAAGGLAAEALLPGEALARALPEGHGIVGLDGSWLYLYREDGPVRWRWWLRRMDGTFPPIGRVIPASPALRVRIQAEPWADRLRHLGRLDSNGIVKMILSGGTLTAAASSALAEATVSAPAAEVEVLREGAAPDATWGWRGEYAADALAAAGPGHADLLLAGPLEPIVIRPAREGGAWGGLVMPVRLG